MTHYYPHMPFVYALCSPSSGKIRYIGQSANPARRLRGHMATARNGAQTPLARWIRKLGSTPMLMILEECSAEEVSAREIHHIASHSNLLNITAGGDGIRAGFKHEDTEPWKRRWTDDERRKQSERLKNAYAARPELREARVAEARTPEALERSQAAARKRWDRDRD